MDFLLNLSTLELAILAAIFTWFATMAGASLVFVFKNIQKKYLNGMLGFAAGIMIAASIWSLIEPAFEITETKYELPWLPILIGFLSGAGFIFIIDKILPHLHFENDSKNTEGIKTKWNRSTLLVLAVTLHNIPEGLAIGVAFASLSGYTEISHLLPGIMLVVGMSIHNIPEGAAVSLPLFREGMSKRRAFFWGQFSGMVEVLGAIIGVLTVLIIDSILPYALTFAAGAMIYVVVEELIPQAQSDGKTDIPTIGAILGFSLMMVLDKAIG